MIERATERATALPLALLPDTLAVCRLGPDDEVPGWAMASRPMSVVARTPDELSLVVVERFLPTPAGREPGLRVEGGWRAFMVRGPLPFHLVGILAAIADPLAAAGISVFPVATYDTDYVLVKEGDRARARAALVAAGHEVRDPG